MGFVCIFIKMGFSIYLRAAASVTRFPGNLYSSPPVKQVVTEKREWARSPLIYPKLKFYVIWNIILMFQWDGSFLYSLLPFQKSLHNIVFTVKLKMSFPFLSKLNEVRELWNIYILLLVPLKPGQVTLASLSPLCASIYLFVNARF